VHDRDTSPVQRYADLVDELVGRPGVTPPERGAGFGRSTVRYNGKIFAMLVRGRLTLKLPEHRVAELTAAGEGEPFDANKGKPMREWISLHPDSALAWLALATEALDFARSATGVEKRRSRS
jgi:TfoX/Sxy family transcriptional regulator of competence genes